MADLNHLNLPNRAAAGTRNRSRYAPDKQVERLARLAVKTGLKLKLGADGSVEVLGELYSTGAGVLASLPEGDDADEEIRRCREAIAAGKPAPPPAGR